MNVKFDTQTVVSILTILGGVIALAIPLVQLGDFSYPALLVFAGGIITLVINLLNKKAYSALELKLGLKK
jgi:hypothetical protein